MTPYRLGAVVLAFGLATAADAQNNTLQPSAGWNSSWGFASPAQQSIRLLQAESIERQENDFYDSVTHANTEVHGDFFSGGQDNSTPETNTTQYITEQYNNTSTVVGSINETQQTIGDGVTLTNTDISSTSTTSGGCQDGTISIASGGGTTGSNGC